MGSSLRDRRKTRPYEGADWPPLEIIDVPHSFSLFDYFGLYFTEASDRSFTWQSQTPNSKPQKTVRQTAITILNNDLIMSTNEHLRLAQLSMFLKSWWCSLTGFFWRFFCGNGLGFQLLSWEYVSTFLLTFKHFMPKYWCFATGPYPCTF